MNTYSIEIKNSDGKLIAENPSASPELILTYISKGYIVVNKATQHVMESTEVSSLIGASEAIFEVKS